MLPALQKLKRDGQVRYRARQLVKLVPAINLPEYRPLILNFARLSILCDRAYDHLRNTSLLNADGELKSSLSVYRQLTSELRASARELGLSPTVAASLARPVKVLDLDSMRDAEDVE
jgi:hypothetical protein